MKKSLEDKVKQIIDKSNKLSKEHSLKEINDAMEAIGVKPFGDPPGVCTPPKIWNPFLNRCVDGIG